MRNMTLYGKPADINGRLHLKLTIFWGSGWQLLLWIRDRGGEETKEKGHLILQVSPRMASLRQEEVWILLKVRTLPAPPPILLLCTSPRPAPPGFPQQPWLRPQGPASARSTCVLYLPLRPVPSDPATHPSSLWPTQLRRQRLEGELTTKIRTVASGLGVGYSRLCPC